MERRIADALTGRVLVPGLDRQVPAQQFGAGIVDHRDGPAAPFDTALFTHAAMTAGRSRVAIDAPAVARARAGVPRGGGAGQRRVAAVRLRAVRTPGRHRAGGEDDVTLISGRESRDVPPRQDMVF